MGIHWPGNFFSLLSLSFQLELKLGLGGTSYADFIRGMHLPMQLRYCLGCDALSIKDELYWFAHSYELQKGKTLRLMSFKRAKPCGYAHRPKWTIPREPMRSVVCRLCVPRASAQGWLWPVSMTHGSIHLIRSCRTSVHGWFQLAVGELVGPA
ncbi:hypothetical protein BHE74_00036064, partial [Ensete ventricosum]